LKPSRLKLPTKLLMVAPRAGAWIETLKRERSNKITSSPPARGRGLKPENQGVVFGVKCRPPRGGVD